MRNTTLATAMLLTSAAPGLAGTLYWDPNGATPGVGGTGTWDTGTTANWSTSSAGNVTTGLWNQPGGQDVAEMQFTAINQTITVSGTVNVNTLNITSMSTANPNTVYSGGTVNLTGAATINLKFAVDGANQWITFNSNITGSNGLNVTGKGSLELGGNNTYLGTTTLNPIRNVDITASGGIPASSLVNVVGGSLRIRNGASGLSFAGLTGGGAVSGQGSGGATLNLSSNSGLTHNYSGALGGPRLNLTKQGNYTQIFSGTAANVYLAGTQPTLSVQGGTLALAKTANIDAVGDWAVTLSGGQIRLDADHQINNAADLNFAGGTLNLNGNDETLDQATLTANSSINFVGGTSILSLASLTRTGGLLTIHNWSGNQGIGGGLDQLRVTTLPADPGQRATLLANIRFTNWNPVTIAVNQGSYFEIVPMIPEPASAMAGAFIAAAAFSRRRRA